MPVMITTAGVCGRVRALRVRKRASHVAKFRSISRTTAAPPAAPASAEEVAWCSRRRRRRTRRPVMRKRVGQSTLCARGMREHAAHLREFITLIFKCDLLYGVRVRRAGG